MALELFVDRYAAWVIDYNTVRPHSVLGGLTCRAGVVGVLLRAGRRPPKSRLPASDQHPIGHHDHARLPGGYTG